ncbi:hypothetical protein BH10PAT3_BH10PAT3_0470 [soil metagenome]
MPAEYLCPNTNLPCPVAQMAGEVLSENIIKLLRVASEKVAVFGYLANLEMRIDRDSITNIRAIEQYTPADDDVVMQAIADARNDVVSDMMPAFRICGGDETGAGMGCDIERSNEQAKRTSAEGSLQLFTSRIIEHLTAGEQGKS